VGFSVVGTSGTIRTWGASFGPNTKTIISFLNSEGGLKNKGSGWKSHSISSWNLGWEKIDYSRSSANRSKMPSIGWLLLLEFVECPRWDESQPFRVLPWRDGMIIDYLEKNGPETRTVGAGRKDVVKAFGWWWPCARDTDIEEKKHISKSFSFAWTNWRPCTAWRIQAECCDMQA